MSFYICVHGGAVEGDQVYSFIVIRACLVGEQAELNALTTSKHHKLAYLL